MVIYSVGKDHEDSIDRFMENVPVHPVCKIDHTFRTPGHMSAVDRRSGLQVSAES